MSMRRLAPYCRFVRSSRSKVPAVDPWQRVRRRPAWAVIAAREITTEKPAETQEEPSEKALAFPLGNGNDAPDDDDDEDDLLQLKAQKSVTWLGLYWNLALAAAKGGVGLFSGSMALLADAVHSGSDVCGDIVALAAVTISKRPADEEHPFGYGAYETLASLTVAMLMLGGGISTGYESFQELLQVSESESTMLKNIPSAFAVIAGSMVVKEWLYQKTVRIGKETRSPVLVANAWHHRTDALSSLMSLVGVGGVYFGMFFLDPVAGLLVSGMVLKAGVDVGWDACQDLVDRRRKKDLEVIEGVHAIAQKLSTRPDSAVIDVHNVRVRRLGHYMLLDLHLRVASRLSVSGGYVESNRFKRHIYRAFPQVNEVMIHVQAHPSQMVASQVGQQPPEINDPEVLRKSISFQHNSPVFSVNPEQPAKRVQRKPRQFQKTVRSHFEIERDVKAAVERASQKDSVIRSFSHCQVYYEAPNHLKPQVFVEVNLKMDKDVTMKRAEEAAMVARGCIMQIKDVTAVDLHVELLD